MPVSAAGTVGGACVAAIAVLRAAGVPGPRLEAELLVAWTTGRDRAWVIAHPEAALDADAERALEGAIGRRAAGEPMAYIRGFREWRSLRILTDPRALIPRPETELVADAAIEDISARLARGAERIVAWDLGTGSGAIAVALALRFRQALALGRVVLVASDASPEALELAAENLAAHGVEGLVQLALADLLEPAGDGLARPDVLTANLPYVASDEVDARTASLGHEPRVALDGGRDGLVLLRRLLGQLPQRMAPGGTVLLEIGVDQAAAIRAIAPAGAEVHVVPDLAGLERVIRVSLRP